ncbi:putative external nadh-ubiquinone oxidoreductase mitochondrial precursor protein [Zalerion maritima]|uniref:External nadh-ubiquinone oxidoreductase mitochondrial protein n=1 Tax=Zalerion maritima TaxID=339359 RepID=A0AAD5RFF3_9PEZI|nr:putative external nadh-ubiquinone oxidoreductase mitochondrial precursor protein [Zalerion maritima]
MARTTILQRPLSSRCGANLFTRSTSASSRTFSVVSRPQDEPKKERVVILGSGWAGYGVARTLDPKKYERIVVSPRSYFVFTPLLASTAVGTLEFRAVLEPIRRLGVKFHQGWADDIDFTNKTIRVEANASDEMSDRPVTPPPVLGIKGSSLAEPSLQLPSRRREKGEMFEVGYDKLVVAVGAYSQTFGIEGVRKHAHFLRDIGDARRIRLRVLSLFEQCSYPDSETGLSEKDKSDLLHFAIVGGGPTGIEFAAELHDLIHEDLKKMYPDLVKYVSITVYDVAKKILPMFDQALARYAMDTFARQGIKVETEKHLDRIREDESGNGTLRIKVRELGDEEKGAGLVVWSTGLMQNPMVEKLKGKRFKIPGGPAGTGRGPLVRLLGESRTGGIVTDGNMRAKAYNGGSEKGDSSMVLPDVFVVGDCATVEDQKGLPNTAQVASQQANYLAQGLNKGALLGKPFKFRNLGTLTYVGGWKAIHQGEGNDLRGWAAWVVWRTAYLTKSMSVRNKLMVPVHWLVTWLFGRDISRF